MQNIIIADPVVSLTAFSFITLLSMLVILVMVFFLWCKYEPDIRRTSKNGTEGDDNHPLID